ncbi:PREDICTED: poly [ADP-ribose] polymerase 14-like [Condylura cristata]|uniref:poly [ADP-ribose] polymerase 14-like n=1 Tax=Condylura cristata TaxID=143302 RepID=UPI0003344363|nr:PREDICTED: poly [ADP-ribose] polymerase 14-like [Condylura cristata]
MAASGSFPLLVQGSWGPDPLMNLCTEVQQYFQSAKRSGGGDCEIRQEPGSPPCFKVLFFREDVRQRVLDRDNHELVWPGKGTFKLTVKLPTTPNKVHNAIVEEVSVEESKTQGHAKEPDVMKFVADCAKVSAEKQLQLSPRPLEVTRTIRVENLPPGVDVCELKLVFENPDNGGGSVTKVEYSPEESSALIEFLDRKVVDTIMTKQLQLNKMPLSVLPYYQSLGTTLCRKEKPLSKLPAPFKESLDIPLWEFLHKQNQLIEEINDEMRRCHCELTWSELNREVTIRPAPSLLHQGRQRIKSWQKNASSTFAHIKSNYKVSSFKVDTIMWDTRKSDLKDNSVLVEFDTLLEIVTLVGRSEDVQKMEAKLIELTEGTIQRIKREQQSLKEKVSLSPGRFPLLCHSGTLTEDPKVEILYDKASQHMVIKGLPAAVYKMKCEVLEKVYAMAQKHIEVLPEILQFLQQVDSAEFSKSLFIAQKIPAIYELKGPNVLLTSCNSEVLLEAESHITRALTYQRICVEDREVLNGRKWKGFTCRLEKQFNSPSKTVIISELTSDVKSEVIVAGCVKEVNKIHDSLFDFLDKHMIITRIVEIKSFLIIDYLRTEERSFLQKFRKSNMQVDFILDKNERVPKGILFTGPKVEVLKGIDFILQAWDSLCIKSICIDQPGARQIFQEKEQFYRGEVKRLFGCFIELQENEGKEGGADGQKRFCRADLAPGVSLVVQQGDLAGFPVEVVVNAANEELKLIGGLAAALLKAGGPELQADCDQIVKRTGKILPGRATISKPGKLPYRHVIHAVGPRWSAQEAQRCVSELKSAVEESLRLAEKHNCQSIAIPAIRSGIFGFPLSQCVETIVSAVKGFFQHKSDGCALKEIYLVDTAETTVEAFASAVRALFKDTRPEADAASLPSVPAAEQPDLRQDHGNGQVLLTPEGLRVLLVKGEVQSVAVDVVVNSVPLDLALDRGALSKALLGTAGPKLQEELNTAGQAVAVGVGTVLLTSGCNLQCQHVLHVVAPSWRNDSMSAYKSMEDLIRTCLEITESLSVKSIAFPAIGTGNLGFPKPVFARLIMSEVFKFSSKNQATSLQEVQFLLHPEDHETIQAFSDEFSGRANGNLDHDAILKTEDTQGVCGSVSSPQQGVHTMRIGPITFEVTTGDITKEEADVIVNSTSNTFDHKAGVSKAILEGAGKDIAIQCQLQGKQGNTGYIITEGGLLKCKNIIHVVGGNDVKNSVTCVLQESENRNYSSICLPAIGTGGACQDPDKVAGAIIDAIEGFVQKGSVQSVKKVKVILFFPHLLNVFYANMKRKEGSQSLLQQFKDAASLQLLSQSLKKHDSLVLETKRETVTFQVCGEKAERVERSLSWLQAELKKEHCSYTSEDECIKDFDEKEAQKLNELQKKSNITISLNRKRPLIEVLGISRDVTEARDEIEAMLKRARLAKEQEARADYVHEFIEWQYNDNNTYYCFDKMTNLQLEDTWKNHTKTTEVVINHQTYTVNLNMYIATNANGHTVSVHRLKKPEVEIPAHWTDMKQQDFLMVTLQPDHPEYKVAADAFNLTCANFRIEKIERIQNTDLWNSYQRKKKIMDAKNNNVVNEKLLFHGTDADSVPRVNRNGFNRSYAGKNAVAYGKGTYFAVSASYSANDKYSKPDGIGNKHMYYVRVLTGLSTLGNSSLIVPPPKDPQNPTDLYDTVTDNVSNPSLFVVFYDYQAYPEYLITFR